MSFGSTMQFMRTGTSSGCGPIPKPIAGAAEPEDTHGMLPEGYAGNGAGNGAGQVSVRAPDEDRFSSLT